MPENRVVSEHDGVYLVHSKYVDQYVERYRPQCLRSTIASGKDFALDFMNFKVSKGATFERVLIMQTAPIKAFIQKQISWNQRRRLPFMLQLREPSKA